jgi:hypothetical protein
LKKLPISEAMLARHVFVAQLISEKGSIGVK